MKAAIARMPGLTRLEGRRMIATIVPMNGTKTPARLATFSNFVISAIGLQVTPTREICISAWVKCSALEFVRQMPKTRLALDDEPWRDLPAGVADLIEGEIEPISAEILESIAREIPEYARPLDGRFGRGIRRGVGEALAQFVAVIRDPDAGRDSGREVYLALGRGEQRAGRTLDSLQAAYRIGARVAWRRFADPCRRADIGAEPLSLLAEAVFAYIDELAADSVEGYAQAQAEGQDVRRRRRRELVALLLGDPPADAGDLAAAARA